MPVTFFSLAVFLTASNFGYQICLALFVTGKPVDWNTAADRSAAQVGVLLICWALGFHPPG